MKYSTRLADAAHVMLFIHNANAPAISSAEIAKSICTNPAYVRQLMAKLKAAGLLLSTRGAARPQLTRNPADISLLDVYNAVEGGKPLLHLDTHVNPDCNVGVYIQYALDAHYADVQKAAEARMAEISLADIYGTFLELCKKAEVTPPCQAENH